MVYLVILCHFLVGDREKIWNITDKEWQETGAGWNFGDVNFEWPLFEIICFEFKNERLHQKIKIRNFKYENKLISE